MPKFTLAANTDHLVNYLNSKSWMHAGLDCEFTSLNTQLARLVGFSVCIDSETAMYVPLTHRVGVNVNQPTAIKILETMFTGRQALFYNALIDMNVFQANTGWYPKDFLDVIELVYLNNPDRKRKGLKLVAKEELNYDMEKFESLFSQEEVDAEMTDISTKLPERCVDYACADAWATRAVWTLPKFQKVLKDHPFPVKVDTQVADAIRKVEHNGGMVLNEAYIDEQLASLGTLESALKEQIHRVVGRPFEIGSPKQLGIALFEDLGIPNVGKTHGKNPIYKTGADELEALCKSHQIVDTVLAYRKVLKAKTTYLEKLKKLAVKKIPIRFNFNIYSAPTFRFSAPGGNPDIDGYTGINIQAVSNGEVKDMWGVDLSEDTRKVQGEKYELDKEDQLAQIPYGQLVTPIDVQKIDPVGFLKKPWVIKTEVGTPVCLRETCAGCDAFCSEIGFDTTRRIVKNVAILPSIRQAFRAPEGYTLVSLDYQRQELLIGANLSKDPVWLAALKNGEDVHEQTAADCFLMTVEQLRKLPKKEYKEKRDLGKIVNFAIFYGATYKTVARQAGISDEVADGILKNFARKHPMLYEWIERVQVFSQKHGYTTTWFGRKRWLKEFYDIGTFSMKAFADRSAVNTCIQGTAAEITRIAIARTINALKKAGLTRDKVFLIIQLHDELTFGVRTEFLQEVLPVLAEGMRIVVPDWEVQLDVDAKAGIIWGAQDKMPVPKAA